MQTFTESKSFKFSKQQIETFNDKEMIINLIINYAELYHLENSEDVI